MTTPSNLSQLARYVLLSEASYADLVDKKGNPFTSKTDKNDIAAALAASGMSSLGKNDGNAVKAAQIQLVAQNYTIVAHQPNTGSGFSGTLFQDTASGEYVLAFRGTEISAGWPFDSSNSLRPAA